MAVYEGDYIKKKKSRYICLNLGRLHTSDFWSLRYFSYSANFWHIWAHHSFGFFVFLISYKVVLILTAFFFTVIRYYLLNFCVNDLSAFTHFYDFFFQEQTHTRYLRLIWIHPFLIFVAPCKYKGCIKLDQYVLENQQTLFTISVIFARALGLMG